MKAALLILALWLRFEMVAFAAFGALAFGDKDERVFIDKAWVELNEVVDPNKIDESVFYELSGSKITSRYLGWRDSKIQLIIDLENPSSNTITTFMSFELMLVNAIKLYKVNSKSNMIGSVEGHDHETRTPTFMLDLVPGSNKLLLEIEPSNWFVSVNAYLQSMSYVSQKKWRSDAFIAATFSVMLGIIVFNILASMVLKDRVYAAYSCYLFGYTYTCGYVEGLLPQILPRHVPEFFLHQLPAMSIHIGYLGMAVFIADFLNFRVNQPRLAKLLPYLITVFCFGMLVSLIHPESGHFLFTSLYPLAAAAYIYGVVKACWKGNTSTIIFAIGWTGVLGAQILTTPIYAGYIDYRSDFIHFSHIAVAVESVLFSVALSARFYDSQRLNQVRIEALNEELREHDRQRTHFFHNISHELRTPLNGILGYATLLVRHSVNKPDSDAPRKIIRLTEQLKTQVNAILALAKYESQGLRTFAQPIQLESVVAEVKTLLDGLVIQEEKLKTSVHVDLGNVSEWIGDREKLLVIINNLVSNACKFSDRERPNHVELLISLGEQRQLTIRVSDTGVGVPDSQKAIIFQAFRQVEMNLSRRFEGTGIGLALVKSYVELWGGHLHFESQEGAGSHFQIILPELTLQENVIREEEPAPIHGLNKTEPQVGAATLSSDHSLQDAIHKDFTGVSILVVDDRLENREVLSELLQSEGASVDQVESAMEARKHLQEQHYDLVLLDIMMPDVNGFEFMEQLRQEGTIFHSSFVVVSALAESEIRLQALEKGALDVISKPFDLDELRFRLLNSLARLRYVQGRERDLSQQQMRQYTDMTADLSHEIKNLILCDETEIKQMVSELCIQLSRETPDWFELRTALGERRLHRYEVALKRQQEFMATNRFKGRHLRSFLRMLGEVDSQMNIDALVQDFESMDARERQRTEAVMRASLYLYEQLYRQTSLKDIAYQMLEFSRTVSQREETDVITLISNCLALQKRKLIGAGVEIQIKGSSFSAVWPLHEMRQVFINLISNAIDALRKQESPRKIEIEVRQVHERLEVFVRDNGPGIQPGWEEKIWLRHASTKGSSAGYGLGLALARELMRGLGGDLTLENRAQPTEFRMVLPVPKSLATEKAA